MARNEKIDFKYNFKLYWELVKPYKGLALATLIVILIVEALRTLDKFLFKYLVDEGTAFASGVISRSIFVEGLIAVGILFLGALVIRATFKWFHIHFINQLDGKLILDLKKMFFNHIVHLSNKFHTTHKTGSLISRLVRGGSAVERMTDVFVFNVAPLLFQLLTVSASLLLFDVRSAIIAFVTVIVFIAWSMVIQLRQQSAKIDYNDKEDWEKAKISDYFMNIDSIKYFGKEKTVKERYKKLGEKTKKSAIYYWDFYRWMDFGQSLIIGVGTFLLMYFPLQSFLAGEMSIGTMVFIYTVFLNLLGPMFGFVHGMRGFYQAMGDFESLFQYKKIFNEVKDKKGAQPLQIKEGAIKFDNVTFGYNERTLFDGFSLDIQPNTKVALVGHSGSGKSTLVKMLYRLFDLRKGKITIDGIDIKDVQQESLRGELSIVPQECMLFDDTIFNNIAFARPEASKEEVRAAMTAAQLDRIVDVFPQGENTIVGERGVKLSGGEKQRVSIARALLADKKVLLLDEATSALDSQTEHDIQEALATLMEGRTTIIIAHRLSTIMHADNIVVLEYGNIVQMGKHQELINQPGVYSTLWNLQKGGYLPGNSDD